MQGIPSPGLAAIILLFAASPAFAGPCASAIDQLQAEVDAAIDSRAGAGPSKPESLGALRGYQPTPRSIAAAEGTAGKRFKLALVLLDRARAADRADDLRRCDIELDKARRALPTP